MELAILRELQARGRFFWEVFPGAKASDERLRQREQIEQNERIGARRSPPATMAGPEDKQPDPAYASEE
jgi:hypothetical protein